MSRAGTRPLFGYFVPKDRTIMAAVEIVDKINAEGRRGE